MTTPAIEGLIERLEKASGPDRQLDKDIAALCHPTDDPRMAAFESGRDYPDHYTGSIDAWLPLVPKGCAWQVGCNSDFAAFALIRGRVQINEFANTPALALGAAILRAISALSKNEGK